MYEAPTPVQMYSVPAVNMNMDLVAISQTGELLTKSICLGVTNNVRIGQNWGFPHSNSVKADGQSEEVGCSAPQRRRKLRPQDGRCPSRALGANCVPN